MPELTLAQIEQQLVLAVDRVMSEGSLYDRHLAALAIKQARGDLVEAIFLLRAHRTMLPRFGASRPLDTARMVAKPSDLGDIQGHPGGPDPGPDVRLSHRLLDLDLLRHRLVREPPRRPTAGAVNAVLGDHPLLQVDKLTKRYGTRIGCRDVSFELCPGEVLGIVGESGSGKTTVLNCLGGRVPPSAGRIEWTLRHGATLDLATASEAVRRRVLRTDWPLVHQNPRDGLRMGVSAGGNVGEPLMAVGARHWGRIRGRALDWLSRWRSTPIASPPQVAIVKAGSRPVSRTAYLLR